MAEWPRRRSVSGLKKPMIPYPVKSQVDKVVGVRHKPLLGKGQGGLSRIGRLLQGALTRRVELAKIAALR